MGEPNNPCFKPSSPYATFTTSTTTSTTLAPETDFFILPTSGVPCPEISFNTVVNEWQFPSGQMTEKNSFTCSSDLYDPNPCILEVDKYIRIADLDIDVNLCDRYKIVLSNIITPQ
jgi:hypothetical protein